MRTTGHSDACTADTCSDMFDVAVIGAGMAGVRAAGLLADAGRRVVVLDKGRRHGGRMATRRVDDASFDTGAVAFTAQSADLCSAVVDWVDEGHVQPGPTGDRDASDAPTHWRGVPLMRSLPTALAARVEARSPRSEVRLATQVARVERSRSGWRIRMPAGATNPDVSAAALVLTPPAPQTIELLTAPAPTASSGARTASAPVAASTLELLEAVRYVPSMSVLVRPVDRALAAIDLMAAQVGPGTAAPDVLRIHDNARTGASPVLALTLQADPAFCAEHLDGDRASAALSLATQATSVLGIELEIVHVHGWRFAQVRTGITCGDGPPALLDATSGAPLVLAGDLFAASWPHVSPATAAASSRGVERAFLSGTAAAQFLLADGGDTAGDTAGHEQGP